MRSTGAPGESRAQTEGNMHEQIGTDIRASAPGGARSGLPMRRNEFFHPDEEILIARTAEDTMRYVREVSEPERRAIGLRARDRVVSRHTARHLAIELENYLRTALDHPRPVTVTTRASLLQRT